MNFSGFLINARNLQIAGFAFLYVAGLVINANALFPYLDEINYSDAIVYLGAGKDLFDYGAFWPYPRGPGIAFIYAVIYAFMPDSVFWLLLADISGRLIAYTVFFVSSALVGRELAHRNLAPALLMVGLLTALPFFIILLRNPSYWTFTSFVSLTLWVALNYARTQKLLPLIAAAAGSSICLMIRPDVIFATSALIGMMLVTRPWRSWRMGVVVLMMGVIPAISVGGYVYYYGQKTGVYLFGGGHKLYDTFASSHMVLFDEKEIAGLHDFEIAAKSRAESARVFGTAKENNYSVFRAVVRNPSVFADIVWHNTVKYSLPNLRRIFGLRVIVDGKRVVDNRLKYFAFVVLFFAALGLIELFRRREWLLLMILAVWPADLGLYLITIRFPDYFPFHFMIVLLLMAVGIWTGVGRLRQPSLLALWGLVLAGVVALDWNAGGRIIGMAIGGAALLVLAALFRHKIEEYRAASVSVLVAGLIIFNLPTTFRAPWHITPKDAGFLGQATFLRQHYPPHTATFAQPGTAVVSAKMWWMHPWADLANIKSRQDFLAKMKLVGMPLILIDPVMRDYNLYQSNSSIQKYAKHYYRTGYEFGDGGYAVLIPKKGLKTLVIPLKR
ncbi:MAG: hypothetical protein HN755_00610 [Rhodospirillales bacterium]|nr:hypothetical protein [Rhodospirillales bacterium]